MFYHCPRCLMQCTCADCTGDSESDEEAVERDTGCLQALDYIYRFWFDLRDESGYLSPVVLEGEVAEKFLAGISPIEFFTNSIKQNEVNQKLMEYMDKFYAITIDSFRVRSPANNDHTPLVAENRPEVVHKIVELKEIFIIE